MNSSSTTDANSQALRSALVDAIQADGYATNPRVAEVMRTRPREPYLPGVALEEVYANKAITIKDNPSGGQPLSCASVPDIVAMMLDLLDVQPGDNVLEIGAGSGVNADYLATLTGPTGHVVTIDVHDDVADHARKALAAAGVRNVEVIAGDGNLGDPQGRTFDKIIVTVGAYEVPTALAAQLAPDGVMVIPLRFRATTRAIRLRHDGDLLRSDAVRLCGFIPMLGQGTERSAVIDAGGHATLYWDTDQPIDPARLTGALDQARVAAWSGETIGPGKPYDGIWLRLAATEPGTCRIAVTPDAVTHGIANPAHRALTPAAVEDDSIAYFALRPPPNGSTGDERRWELGAYGHGPGGAELAERICEQIRAWSPHRETEPDFTVHPLGIELDDEIPIYKHDSTVTIRY